MPRRRNPPAAVCAKCSTTLPEGEETATVRHAGQDVEWCPACVESDALTCEHCDALVTSTQDVTTTNSRGTESDDAWCETCAEDTTSCNHCDRTIPNDESTEVNARAGRGTNHSPWCRSCADENAGSCEHCDETWESDELEPIHTGRNEESWCPPCHRENTFECEHCDTTYAVGVDHSEVEGDTWCEECASSDANWCSSHEQYYTRDECSDCEEAEAENASNLIKDYHSAKKSGFQPIMSPWVRAQPKPLYFGAELEVEVPSGHDRDTYAQKVIDTMGELLAGLEDDGSLSHGFEIVTQPAGLDTHRQTWCQVDLKGLKSHDTTTCGLHVHFTRSAVSTLTLGKMLRFVNSEENKTFLETFARRSSRFAKRDTDLGTSAGLTAGLRSRADRYEALNITGTKTVEFRMPKGTTKCTTILATLEFVYALIRFCESVSTRGTTSGTLSADKKIKGLTVERFKQFISDDSWMSETRFLRAYMVDRGLATAKEMRLPRIKPGAVAPAPEDARENPRRQAHSDYASYAEQALAEYRTTGE